MKQFSTIHIFGYGETQIIGKDNNGILYFGTGHTGVFKSIDNGNNWIYNVADGGGVVL